MANGAFVVEIHVVVAGNIGLACESAQDDLKEGVDCRYVEEVEIEQQTAECFRGCRFQFIGGAVELGAEILDIGARFFPSRFDLAENGQLVDNALLHLVGGLVCERHGEDSAVAVAQLAVQPVLACGRIFNSEQELDVFVGKGESLARTGRCFVDEQHGWGSDYA